MSVRSASQTTYENDKLPSEVYISYKAHPLFGKKVKVLTCLKKGREFFWRIVLPDGSKTDIPISWVSITDNFKELSNHIQVKANPQTLRELIDIMQVLEKMHSY